MKRYVWILFSAVCLAQPGLALKETPPSAAPDSHTQDLSNELDAFVQQALKEGLLSPTGPGAPAEPRDPKPLRPEPAVSAEVAVPAPQMDCSQPYPLDFSEFEPLTQYADIYDVRQTIGSAADAGDRFASSAMARAYLALDLAPEASMTVGRFATGDGVALKYLARLLEQRGAQTSLYFAELAKCYPQAGLWHGLSLLAEGDPAGAQVLGQNLSGFRRLPLQLRDRTAWIAIPALDTLGERTLALKLMTTFTEEQVNNSAQLTFVNAILALGANDPVAEEVIGTFLVQSRFEEVALSALIRHKRPVRESVCAILLEEMVTRIELAQKDADVRGDLRFVLEELGRDSMYLPMIKLAELPSMQTETARHQLGEHLAASLARDLTGDDKLRNLAAIEALLSDPGLLDGMPQRKTLYASATDVAVRLGFGSLAEALAAKAEGEGGDAGQRALLAYRQKDYSAVFAMADRYTDDQRVQLIAAKSAIDQNEKARLAGYESRLKLDPDTVLTLIEHDAAAARWMVSDKVVRAAGALTDEAQRKRVARVELLRNAARPVVPQAKAPIASVPAKLNELRELLKQMAPEAP